MSGPNKPCSQEPRLFQAVKSLPSPNQRATTCPAREVNLSQFYRKRGKNVRKGDFGRVIIAGGSDRYSGCLGLNALAALRSGADLAIVVAPKRAADIVAGYSPDLITIPCNSPFPEPEIVLEVLNNADSLVIGCGVVRTIKAHAALLHIIQGSERPIVADAEALHALASRPDVGRGKRLVLTPNAGEFQVLAGRPWPTSNKERAASVKSLAKRYQSSVILKGALDFISDGDRVSIDKVGSPYLTKGGYGDLLAGITGALLARGSSPFDAARVAAYMVGRAGEMAAKTFGEGTIASDLLPLLPLIIREG